ncbi:unnamed protein product, partial [Allacma fusca]
GPPGQSGLTMRAGVRSVFNPRSESSVREESVNGDETVGRNVTKAGNLYHVYPPVIVKTEPQPLSLYPELEHPQPLLSLPDFQLRSEILTPSHQTNPNINVVFITTSQLEQLQQTQHDNNNNLDSENIGSPSAPVGPVDNDDTIVQEVRPEAKSALTSPTVQPEPVLQASFAPGNDFENGNVDGDETVGRK